MMLKCLTVYNLTVLQVIIPWTAWQGNILGCKSETFDVHASSPLQYAWRNKTQLSIISKYNGCHDFL